jgi:hypothetical protein
MEQLPTLPSSPPPQILGCVSILSTILYVEYTYRRKSQTLFEREYSWVFSREQRNNTANRSGRGSLRSEQESKRDSIMKRELHLAIPLFLILYLSFFSSYLVAPLPGPRSLARIVEASCTVLINRPTPALTGPSPIPHTSNPNQFLEQKAKRNPTVTGVHRQTIMSKPPTGIQPKTRNAKSKADSRYIFNNKTAPEILETTGQQLLKPLPEAHCLLAQYSLNIPDHGISLLAIFTALLEFTSMGLSLTPLISDILRAIHVALDHAISAQTLDEGPQTRSLSHMTKLAELTDHQKAQAERLETIIEDINHIKAAIENSTESLEASTERACMALQEASSLPMRTSTYVEALRHGTPTQHAEVLIQSKSQSRQVIIKCDTEDLYKLSEKELFAKANLAIENLLNQGDDAPMGISFLSMRKLKRLRICFELNSQHNTDWLRKKDNQNTFLHLFGANMSFIDKAYRTIVEFIPITLNSSTQISIRGVENTSGLTKESLKSIKWIKPPQFHKPKQRVAHAVVAFSMCKDANKALQDGLSIEGRKVCAHKQLPEPNRCYNCHSLDQSHFAKECPKGVVCGSCGANHLSQDCEINDPKLQYCVNCNTNSHPTWDCSCKSFTETRHKLWKSNKEAKYKYFPILNDPATWKIIDGDIVNPASTTTPTTLPILLIPHQPFQHQSQFQFQFQSQFQSQIPVAPPPSLHSTIPHALQKTQTQTLPSAHGMQAGSTATKPASTTTFLLLPPSYLQPHPHPHLHPLLPWQKPLQRTKTWNITPPVYPLINHRMRKTPNSSPSYE